MDTGKVVRQLLAPKRSRTSFMRRLPRNARVLDVGCGNKSPEIAKGLRPDIYYVGIDVESLHPEKSQVIADEYIFAASDDFARKVEDVAMCGFDAVISRHNLEHCTEPTRVLRAICSAIVPGGLLYLSFPSEASTRLPSRHDTLNFYDDKTHKFVPCWPDVVRTLELAGLTIICAHRRYRPMIPFVIGLVCEPLMMLRGTTAPYGGTWSLYGFESVIWASRMAGGAQVRSGYRHSSPAAGD
jgi:SAM-dependent methyltransferase